MAGRTGERAKAVVEGEYPIETMRGSYVTRFGGLSTEVMFDEVGINAEALVRNTDLRVGETVTVGVLGEGRRRPYLMEPLYTVTALDSTTPDALQKSRTGEAVFSAHTNADGMHLDALGRRDFVIISGTFSEAYAERGWRLDLLVEVLKDLKIIQN